MTEPDGMGEAIDRTRETMTGYMRVALTVAARAAEMHAHRNAELARVAATWGGEHERAVRQQLAGEAAAVKAELRQVRFPEWWERATPEQMAHAWAQARSYADIDGELRGTANWIGSEIERRHGTDPESLWREAEAQARDGRVQEQAAASLVAEADVADMSAVAVERDYRSYAEDLAQETAATTVGWDSVERRTALAGRMEQARVSPEASEARLLADRGTGAPPVAATRLQPGQSRRPRQQGRGRERVRGTGR